jgi:hypothetical protein
MAQNPIVTFEIEMGNAFGVETGVIKAELYPEIAPNSVNNFISLISKGYYDGRGHSADQQLFPVCRQKFSECPGILPTRAALLRARGILLYIAALPDRRVVLLQKLAALPERRIVFFLTFPALLPLRVAGFSQREPERTFLSARALQLGGGNSARLFFIYIGG